MSSWELRNYIIVMQRYGRPQALNIFLHYFSPDLNFLGFNSVDPTTLASHSENKDPFLD
jgi:hypothetical protein